MKINWFSFKGLFTCLFSLCVFLICRPCLFNNTRSPLRLDGSNLFRCICHCYAEWTTQKRAREHVVLTPRYVWDVYLCSLTQTISLGCGLIVEQLKATITQRSWYLAPESKLNLVSNLSRDCEKPQVYQAGIILCFQTYLNRVMFVLHLKIHLIKLKLHNQSRL